MVDSFVAAGPLVTVYVPCHNYARFLLQAVESVQRQLYANWEMIIFDEASEDETRRIAEALQGSDPDRIRVVCNEKPRGLQWIAIGHFKSRTVNTWCD